MSVSIFAAGRSTEDDMNVSNSNFCRLMDMLDTPIDRECLCGEISGLALINLKLQVCITLESVRAMPELDGGKPAVVQGLPDRCVFIDCGWAPGYLESRLSALLAAIEEAIEENVALVYA